MMDALGVLYIVSTPIGNLQDITLRALEVLKDVDLILSEDTRETKKVLDKFSIEKTQKSYRDQNHDSTINDIIECLKSGKNIALVSDSGTPVISDPGFKLVQSVIANSIQVVSIPGPSAIVAALSISGLPTDKFSFLGFLPKKDGARKKLLSGYGMLDSTLVIYESPYRITKLLDEVHETLGDRYVALCRELTKVYEEVKRGTVSELLAGNIKPKGEYVVLIAKEDFKL